MARDSITLSTARQIIASGKATKQQLVDRFDIIDDGDAGSAPSTQPATKPEPKPAAAPTPAAAAAAPVDVQSPNDTGLSPAEELNLAGGVEYGIKTSILPSIVAGVRNQKPTLQPPESPQIQPPSDTGLSPRDLAVGAESVKQYREGTAGLRARAARDAAKKGIDLSSGGGKVGAFVGSMAGDLPLYVLQPDLEAPPAIARLIEKVGSPIATRVLRVIAKQATNVPMDVAVGAIDDVLKTGDAPTSGDLAKSAGSAFLIRNVMHAITSRLAEPAATQKLTNKANSPVQSPNVENPQTPETPAAESTQPSVESTQLAAEAADATSKIRQKQYNDLREKLNDSRPTATEPLSPQAKALRRRLIFSLRTDDNLGFESPGEAINAILSNDDYATRWELSPQTAAIAERYKNLQGGAAAGGDVVQIQPTEQSATEPQQPAVDEPKPIDRRAVNSGRVLAEQRIAERAQELAAEHGRPVDDPLVTKAAKADVDLKSGAYSANAFADAVEKGGGTTTAIDLAHLGKLNDTKLGREFGDAFGDEVISTTARALTEVAGESGKVYRRGGDEFAILWKDPETGAREYPKVKEALDHAVVRVYRHTETGEELAAAFQGVDNYVGHGSTPDEASAAVNSQKPPKSDVETRGRQFAAYRERIEAGVQGGDSAAGGQGVPGSAGTGSDSTPPAAEEVTPPPRNIGPRKKDAGGADEPPTPPTVGANAPSEPSGNKYARPSSINLERLNVDPQAKAKIEQVAQDIGDQIKSAKGGPLTHEEVIQAAAESTILQKASSREATLKSEAALLATRRHLAALAQRGKITKEFVNSVRVVSAEATRRGRELQALQIGADPTLANVQGEVVRKLLEMGHDADEIVKQGEHVDFTNAREVADYYRKFVKPTLPQILDEYRYINMLSSPKTHIVNAFTNALQVAVLRPADRLATGVVDRLASTLTGRARTAYVRDVPVYYRGAFNALPEAASKAMDALRGDSTLMRPDVEHLPTQVAFLKPFQVVPRALEASDAFFRTLIEGGEREALASTGRRLGTKPNPSKVAEASESVAQEYVFRKSPDSINETGQGHLLSMIDSLTNAVYGLRRVPGVKWFIPFVQTPMNILKQGIEHSPMGFATMAGATNKAEQAGKALVGSTVFAAAGALALDGRTTWALPKDKKERTAFYAAGLQPYAVKVGDKWVQFSKLGPIAYPIAMAAAAKHYAQDDPATAGADHIEKIARIMGGTAQFFADQSYVDQMGKLVDAMSGKEGAGSEFIAGVPSQLIPMSSLIRWATMIIDPVYRKVDSSTLISRVIDNLKKGIPGLSETLPAFKTPQGKNSERQMPVVNAFSPLTVTEETNQKGSYDRLLAARRRVAAAKRAHVRG